MEYLFTVRDTFTIPDRGLILGRGILNKSFKREDKIKLILPNKAVIETKITGIIPRFGDILIDKDFQKEDIPIGTEVWLCD